MVQNKNSNKRKLFEWAYCLNKEQRQKKYEELCKTYNIKENEWTIDEKFDLLENYIFKQYELCQECYIYYFKRSGENFRSAIQKNEVGNISPAPDAEFALFNLNIPTPRNGILFCVFERCKEKRLSWTFKEFISSSDSSEWHQILLDMGDLKPTFHNIVDNYLVGNFDDVDFREISYEAAPFPMDHIYKRYERYLPACIKKVYNCTKSINVDIEDSINKIVEELINNNVKHIDVNEYVLSWAITDFINDENGSEFGYIPINILFPFRFLGEVYAAMVFRITRQKKPCLVTMLNLKQAYSGAKLYNSIFKSPWLSIENVHQAENRK